MSRERRRLDAGCAGLAAGNEEAGGGRSRESAERHHDTEQRGLEGGRLLFTDGYPTTESVLKIRDESQLVCGVLAFNERGT
jgi:hypothetical protein